MEIVACQYMGAMLRKTCRECEWQPVEAQLDTGFEGHEPHSELNTPNHWLTYVLLNLTERLSRSNYEKNNAYKETCDSYVFLSIY